jgi:hypothetical protein
MDMQREAEADAKQKQTVAKKKAATKKATAKKKASAKKATSVSGRMKAVWIVLDASFKTLATFEYRDKTDAEDMAAKLTQKKGKKHVVRQDREPMDD